MITLGAFCFQPSKVDKINVIDIADASLSLSITRDDKIIPVTLSSFDVSDVSTILVSDSGEVSFGLWEPTLDDTCIGICFKGDNSVGILLYISNYSEFTCKEVVPRIYNIKEFIASLSSSHKEKYRQAKLKEDIIKDPFDIYSSYALNEAQVDFLTAILKDIISTNPDLASKYGSALDELLKVSSSTVKPLNISNLCSEKKNIRDLQIEYFKRRDSLV